MKKFTLLMIAIFTMNLAYAQEAKISSIKVGTVFEITEDIADAGDGDRLNFVNGYNVPIIPILGLQYVQRYYSVIFNEKIGIKKGQQCIVRGASKGMIIFVNNGNCGIDYIATHEAETIKMGRVLSGLLCGKDFDVLELADFTTGSLMYNLGSGFKLHI